jgi:hypothetical protein
LPLISREAHGAFTEAVDAADGLLALAAGNAVALDARGLARCGLAITGDPAQTDEAARAFRRARAVHAAPGVLAELTRLFALLSGMDDHSILEGMLVHARDAAQGS